MYVRSFQYSTYLATKTTSKLKWILLIKEHLLNTIYMWNLSILTYTQSLHSTFKRSSQSLSANSFPSKALSKRKYLTYLGVSVNAHIWAEAANISNATTRLYHLCNLTCSFLNRKSVPKSTTWERYSFELHFAAYDGKLGGQCKDSIYGARCGRGGVEICRGGIECDLYKAVLR